MSARFPVIVGQSRLPREVLAAWPRSVPWSFAETFRDQAQSNHQQTLERLAERGGLAPDEMWLAAHGHNLRVRIDQEYAGEWLIAEMRKIEEAP